MELTKKLDQVPGPSDSVTSSQDGMCPSFADRISVKLDKYQSLKELAICHFLFLNSNINRDSTSMAIMYIMD